MLRFLGHGITYHLWFHLCLVSILMFSSYISFFVSLSIPSFIFLPVYLQTDYLLFQ